MAPIHRRLKNLWVDLADPRDMTDEEYHDVADEDMDRLHEALEDLVENFSKDWEVEYSVSYRDL